jgi:hypothetical protein
MPQTNKRLSGSQNLKRKSLKEADRTLVADNKNLCPTHTHTMMIMMFQPRITQFLLHQRHLLLLHQELAKTNSVLQFKRVTMIHYQKMRLLLHQ